MDEPLKTSPWEIYTGHARCGELAYQVSRTDGTPIFYPRVIAPRTGNDDLEWRISAGTGTVYATTVVSMKGEDPYNVALIDLDEGFRMLSRVEGLDPAAVMIGTRVRVRFVATGDSEPPLPVFVPVEAVP